MFGLPGLEGVEEVVISREVVEGTTRPLCIYADRSDRAVESSAMACRLDRTKRTLPHNIRPRYVIGVKTWVRLFDLSQSPSGSELVLFEKLERHTTASFRRLIPSASRGTRHPQAICTSAQMSIAARGAHHDQFIAVLCSFLGVRLHLDAILPDGRTVIPITVGYGLHGEK